MSNFHSQQVLNMMKLQAQIAFNGVNYVATGIITAVDLVNFLANVELLAEDPEDPTGTPAQQTGWIPIGMPYTGNGWGMVAPPNIGDVCIVHYPQGSVQNGFVGMRLYGDNRTPPQALNGELYFVHSSGTFIKLTNDGKLSLKGDVEIDLTSPTINITSSSVVNINAPAVIIGEQSNSPAFILNENAAVVFKEHTHNTPAGVSDPPNQTFGPSTITQNVKAS